MIMKLKEKARAHGGSRASEKNILIYSPLLHTAAEMMRHRIKL
jgi:hypothetical protein